MKESELQIKNILRQELKEFLDNESETYFEHCYFPYNLLCELLIELDWEDPGIFTDSESYYNIYWEVENMYNYNNLKVYGELYSGYLELEKIYV